MTRPRVYVAASSHELERTRLVMQQLIGAGFLISHDWTHSVEAKVAAGIAESKMDDDECARCARTDLEAVASSDVVVLLAPNGTSKLAWGEYCFGLAHGIPCITAHPSADVARQSIVTRLGIITTDADIVETALVIAKPRTRWERRLQYVRWLISQILAHAEKRRRAVDPDRIRSLSEQIDGDLHGAGHALIDAMSLATVARDG